MSESMLLRWLRILLILVVILALTAACGSGEKPPAGVTPAASAAKAEPPQALAKAATPHPTQASEPAAIPEPTQQSAPSPEVKPTATAEPAATTEPTAPSGQAALDLLLEVAQAQAAQGSMRMTMTSEKGGQVTKMVMELVRPDRLKSTGGPGGDLIIVPEGTCMKPTGGAWQKAPFDMSDNIGEMLSQASVER